MKHGFKESGCNKKDCSNTCHPRICGQSLKFGVCDFIGTSQRCTRGYHLKGTKKSDKDININQKEQRNSKNLNLNPTVKNKNGD